MKIDFEHPDSLEQLKNLHRLLHTTAPSGDDIVMAVLFASMIFYENRPGNLEDLPGYCIHGTGCHNPTSEKTGKTVWNIWRIEVTIEHEDGSSLLIKQELTNGGYLRAIFKNRKITRVASADICAGIKEDTVTATSITVKHRQRFMEDLRGLVSEPLNVLLTIAEQEVIIETV